MANCSIPNSSPASGRISTRSLRRLRKQNSEPLACTSANRGWWLDVRKRRQVRHVESVLWRTAALQSVLRARKIRRWALDVGRWEFSAIRRVKGAWWPSRSSKPSSPRKWRGRFDSYPLREFFLVILSGAKRSRRIPLPYLKLLSPGFLDFARNDEIAERG
jgi:hypothetical protein